MRKVAIHQPNFLPWVGWWNKFLYADVFILYCGVQVDWNGFQRRQRLDETGGWVTIPCVGSSRDLIPKLRIEDRKALTKIAKRIERWSAGMKYRDRVMEVVEQIRAFPVPGRLVDLNIGLIRTLATRIEPNKRFLVDFREPSKRATSTQALMDRVRSVSGKVYCAGSASMEYMDMKQVTVPLDVQSVHARAKKESILRILGTCEDPLLVIWDAASWVRV